MASIRKLKSGKWQVTIRKSNHKYIFKTFIEKAVITYNLTKNNYLIKFDKKEVLVKSFEGVFEKF